jgi:curved DNA-binding protein CbpA
MANRDYYEVLGVTRGATDHDIRRAFRELAKIYHPDRNPGDAEAEGSFKNINEAYDALRDANRRAIYDHHLAEAEEDRFEKEPTGSLWQGFMAVLIMIVVLGGASILYYVFWLKHSGGIEKGVERGAIGPQDKKKDQEQLNSKNKSTGSIGKSGPARDANRETALNGSGSMAGAPQFPEAPKGDVPKSDAPQSDAAKSDNSKPEQAEAPVPTAAALWEKLRESDDLLALQDFIEKHHDSVEANAARSRLQRAVAASEDIMALEALAQLAQSRLSSELETPDLARKRVAELREARAARAQDDSDWKTIEGKADAESVLG